MIQIKGAVERGIDGIDGVRITDPEIVGRDRRILTAYIQRLFAAILHREFNDDRRIIAEPVILRGCDVCYFVVRFDLREEIQHGLNL